MSTISHASSSEADLPGDEQMIHFPADVPTVCELVSY